MRILKPGEGMIHVMYNNLSDGPGEDFDESAYEAALEEMGIYAQGNVCLYDAIAGRYVVPRTRANQVDYGCKDGYETCFDISGGNCANETIPFLKFQVMRKAGGMLWGYSDLTPVLNAIHVKAKIPSVLYQTRNLMGQDEQAKKRRELFQKSCIMDGRIIGSADVMAGKVNGGLFQFDTFFIRGEAMEGIIVGGNARCFLKLAGTPYFPDMEGKILLLEALGGDDFAVASYFAQLSMMGVFDKVAGVILGKFTKLEEEATFWNNSLAAFYYLDRYIPKGLPVARTAQVGHQIDSRAVLIGAKARLSREESITYLPMEEEAAVKKGSRKKKQESPS